MSLGNTIPNEKVVVIFSGGLETTARHPSEIAEKKVPWRSLRSKENIDD